MLDIFHHHSQTAAATSPRHAAPGSWTDLKRDWHRWSRAERIAAECFGIAVLVGGALFAAMTSLG